MDASDNSDKPGLCRLDDKVVLITGSSSGIGAETAVLFAELGAKLALTGRAADNLRKTAEQCESINSHKALCVVADLSKEDDIRRLIKETTEHYGRLDILVNNAGVRQMGTIETFTPELYDKCMDVNARSVYFVTSLAVPHLIKTKGTIVNVSSIAGMRSFAGALPYCMSKSAVDQLTRCIALELASKQVRVNSVNPGVIVTGFQKRAGMSEEDYAKFLDRTTVNTPLGRVGTVKDVSKAIAFLASDASSFITGAHIPIAGGYQVSSQR